MQFTDKVYQHRLIGSIFYAAPEVFDGEIGLPRDIWSCGILFYILLVGYPPYSELDDSETIKKI